MKKGLTFKTLVGFDDFQKEFELIFNEHRDFIKLIMGDNYGIVSDKDVKELSPLYPTLNDNILSVTEGKIVTKNGDVTTVEEFSKEIGSFSEDLAVLFVYEMIGSSEKRVTNDGNAASVWYERKSTEDSILVIKASSYNSLSDEVKNNSVCICIVKYSTTTPYIDLTNSEYTFNRPWFSPTDIAHRLEKGTGSSDVPHSIGINDLSSSDVTLYNQLLSRGIIVSKDTSIAGVPGKSYKIKVSVGVGDGNTIEDTDFVAYLNCYPNAIGYCSKNEDGEGYDDVSAFLREGTNLIDVNDFPYGIDIYLDVILTKCLMPPVSSDSLTTELTFGTNDDNDIIITEGKQTELVDPTISFSNCGATSKTYEVVFGADGKLHKEPDILGFSSLLSSLNEKTYNQEYSIPVRVQIELDLNGASSSYYIKINVVGINENGEEDNEELEWEKSDYVDSIKNTTKKFFKRISKINVIESENAPVTCKVTAFAVANSALDNRLRVALVDWNYNEGIGTINNIKDIRPIANTIRDPFDLSVTEETGKAIANSIFFNSLYNNITSNASLILVEDFRKVSYLSSQSVNWRITPYGINFPIINNNIFDSRTITDCYRSRRINVENQYIKYAVILINSDYETSHSNSVRLGMYDNNNKYYEFPMVPVVDENGKIEGNGVFMLYSDSINIKHIQVIVSGKASGYVLLRLSGTTSNEHYEVSI